MKKIVFILLMIVGFSGAGNIKAQNVLDGVYPKEHIHNRKPIPFAYVREADVLWAKKIWRVIDLREKINLPLYYPITPMDGRFSLVDLLLQGIQYENIKAYKDDEFKTEKKVEDILRDLGATTDTTQVKKADGTYEDKIIVQEVRSYEVKQFLVKEVWFFDRNYSRLDVRIVGLCPVREYEKTGSDGQGQILKKQVFWVYFPEVRDLLARNEVFNPKNDAMRHSFDDIFLKRYFGSYIIKESNVYNNRRIEDYTAGMDAFLESERIKNSIFNQEQDMWQW
ncbi:MAG: gliding motility protein GldN [Chlorobi bacterium]|nr:gliding motility protein GldN [Chlorobiota bacterium]